MAEKEPFIFKNIGDWQFIRIFSQPKTGEPELDFRKSTLKFKVYADSNLEKPILDYPVSPWVILKKQNMASQFLIPITFSDARLIFYGNQEDLDILRADIIDRSNL